MISEASIIIFLAAFALVSNFMGVFHTGYLFSESCGQVFNVPTNRYHDKGNCSDPSYELVCENNRSVLYVNYGRHLIEAIYATNSTTALQSITAGLDINNCPAISRQSLAYNNFSQAFTAKETELDSKNNHFNYYVGGLVFVGCQNPLSPDRYPGLVALCTNEAPETLHPFVLTWYSSSISGVPESCRIDLIVKVVPWGPMACNESCSYPKVQRQEVKGIEVRWRPNRCGVWDAGPQPDCWFENATNMVLCPSQDYGAAICLVNLIFGELHGYSFHGI
ncbi:uncharacterized protein LOC114758961 [Neltuma alba]|uniref:uncharacterized protein LOC114758961 n=1 Tax=Neltuma alba TaxID=207710 RepID=UPI0010A34AD2|nr:uncharacterized protein LOC114758961 [Prosopis alba]